MITPSINNRRCSLVASPDFAFNINTFSTNFSGWIECVQFQNTIISNVTHLPSLCEDLFLEPTTFSEPILRMKVSSSTRAPKKRLNLLSKGSCRTFCCGCRLSVSSSEEADSVSSGRFVGISSLAHAMVQERLDQMIRERQEERRRERQGRRKQKSMARNDNKFVIMMMAMEKSSYDPRQDFQDSIVEMITANKIKEAKDLRCLLNYYLSMNSNECGGLILEVFHDVCRSMFFGCESR